MLQERVPLITVLEVDEGNSVGIRYLPAQDHGRSLGTHELCATVMAQFKKQGEIDLQTYAGWPK